MPAPEETPRSGGANRARFKRLQLRSADAWVSGSTRLALAATPVFLHLGHLAYGAESAIGSMWFTVLAALLALAAFVHPRSASRFGATANTGPALLFILVILAAGLSLARAWPAEIHRLTGLAAMPKAGAINISSTLLEVIKLMGLACVFLLGCAHGARRRWVRVTMASLTGVGGVYAIIALALYLSGHQHEVDGRLTGGFLSANTGALVFGMLAILAAAAALRAWRAREPGLCVLSIAQTGLFAVCVFMTASRMGMASTVLAGAVLVVWDFSSRRNAGLALILVGCGLAGGVSLLLLAHDSLLAKRMGGLDDDLPTRLVMFKSHWRAFLDAPLAGYGLGSFTDLNNIITRPDTYGTLTPIRAAHNVYIQWLEEAGILGATPMFLLVGLILVPAAALATSARAEAATMRGLVCASILVLLLGLTDFGLQVLSVAAFWSFLLGLLWAMSQARRRDRCGPSIPGRAQAAAIPGT